MREKSYKDDSTIVDESFLTPLVRKESCSESDEQIQMRQLVELKKQIKKKIKKRKENKKVFIGSGYSFDLTEYFRFKKNKETSDTTLLKQIIGDGGYLAWLILLFAVINASLIPSWSFSIATTKIIGMSWRFFLQSFLLFPFLMYEYRTADEQTKKKFGFTEIFNPQNLKRVFLISFSASFWFFCIGTFSQWTHISHALALGSLINFFLSIDRRVRSSGHDLQPGGQVLVIVGIFLIFQDSYSFSVDRADENEWKTSYHGYLQRSRSQRMLADLGALVLSFILSKLSAYNSDLRDTYPPYLSLMMVSLLTAFNLILAAFFFNGATFTFEQTWGIFSLFVHKNQNDFTYIGVILCLGLILSFTVVSKLYPSSLIPSIAMSFEPILSSLFLQFTGIQFMPDAFGCLGFLFILLGTFLILIGQWMFQRINKKQEIQEKLMLAKLMQKSAEKERQAKKKKKEAGFKLKKKNSLDVYNIKYEKLSKKLQKKPSIMMTHDLPDSKQILQMKAMKYRGNLEMIEEDQ